MRITRENIIVRSAQIDDAETLASWWNDGRVMSHAGFPLGLNIDIDKVEADIRCNETNKSQLCIIEIDGNRVGECNYRIKKDFAEIGIKICEINYQNKGLGTKILLILIDFIFTDDAINHNTKIKKIILDTNLENKRAQHVYEKIGFRKVGINIDAWKNQLGQLCSSVDYEITYDDYLKKYK